ncbi:hypothetical protein PENARI_c003G09669 [Penicillium arizonense]|uniref:Uncharacterized protein n=1 Tax=Penicillium arizonense TaxID=1835702 RepID=A0A1F5LSA6_PENAI|nr:hypothetical protein PENARI_c003G09669 [Penicillium arizonense]OGE55910.1 hypothetical protein PENARI_c003G09669 [Penicillium arizonense]
MSERINGTVSEWNGSVQPPYGFIDVEGLDKHVAFSLEDVKENRDEVLKVGAKVSFLYEPGTFEQAADDVCLSTFTVAITPVWSGLGYLFSKDAVKILTKEEVQKRMARCDGNNHN